MDEGLTAANHIDDSVAPAALLRLSEQFSAAGLGERAEVVLALAWGMAAGDRRVADAVAWNYALLLLRRGAYDEAATWFGRVASAPHGSDQAWPTVTQVLIELCGRCGVAAGPQTVPGNGRNGRRADRAGDESQRLVPLEVVSLGRFRLARGEEWLVVTMPRKPLAVLRFLLTRPDGMAHREEIIDALWPSADPAKAGHCLHVAVSELRHALDPPEGSYLVHHAGRYLLAPDAVGSDDRTHFLGHIAEGERAMRLGEADRAERSLELAVETYRGDFYVDHYDPPWATIERERLLTDYVTALDRLGILLAAAGRLDEAIERSRLLLDRDEYREDVHRRVMHCYWQLGRRRDALRQYDRCAALLSDELGLAPLPETEELRTQILAAAI